MGRLRLVAVHRRRSDHARRPRTRRDPARAGDRAPAGARGLYASPGQRTDGNSTDPLGAARGSAPAAEPGARSRAPPARLHGAARPGSTAVRDLCATGPRTWRCSRRTRRRPARTRNGPGGYFEGESVSSYRRLPVEPTAGAAHGPSITPAAGQRRGERHTRRAPALRVRAPADRMERGTAVHRERHRAAAEDSSPSAPTGASSPGPWWRAACWRRSEGGSSRSAGAREAGTCKRRGAGRGGRAPARGAARAARCAPARRARGGGHQVRGAEGTVPG